MTAAIFRPAYFLLLPMRPTRSNPLSPAVFQDRRRWLFLLGGLGVWRFRPAFLAWPMTRGLKTAHALGWGSTRMLWRMARRGLWWAWRRS